MFLRRRLPFGGPPFFGRTHRVVADPEEFAAVGRLPAELRYVLSLKPSRVETFRKIIEGGQALEVGMPERPEPRVLSAAENIAKYGQRGTVYPWLPRLLHLDELPVFGQEASQRAQGDGVDLRAEARILAGQRWEVLRCKAPGEARPEILAEAQTALAEANLDLRPFAADVFVRRVGAHVAGRPKGIGRIGLEAVVLVGPVSHLLELVAPGAGKFSAAVLGDLLVSTSEARSLRTVGFTWRQVLRRYRHLFLPLALVLFAAFTVEPLVRAGQALMAGMVFGLACCITPVFAAFRSFFRIRRSLVRLAREGGLRQPPGATLAGLAWRQESANPERTALAICLVVVPLASALVFGASPGFSGNGWILAALGSVRPIVSALIAANQAILDRALFRLKVELALRASVLGRG